MQDEFWSLRDREQVPGGPKTVQGIMATTSFACEEAAAIPPPYHSAILLTGSRFNHSCDPNVTRYWDSTKNVMVFHASRDIDAGEQLFVSYLPISDTYADRKARIDRYHFECKCRHCTASPEERAARDHIAQLNKDMTASCQALVKEKKYAEIAEIMKKHLALTETHYATEHRPVEHRLMELTMTLAMAYNHREFRHYHRQLHAWLRKMVPGHPFLESYLHVYNNPRCMMDDDQMEEYDAWWAREGHAAWDALLAEERAQGIMQEVCKDE
ncbi:hypothetical protein KIPB_003805 [Kipferlia bialata]|uniref:SET domain-containing protein n=1 Tax=Kipferlia bialata TaxID=797122 RepID=A0A9K3CSZ9_9EUKA|nr:hypothetical protein KIPB_003805 [Kipferlia bialata]|eukprot:g3805.t1